MTIERLRFFTPLPLRLRSGLKAISVQNDPARDAGLNELDAGFNPA
ncbi:MAG TPA: hypothetical protein HPP87_12400 [Planctomycetes bacterium]|nr:hypothetical protein [Planctomycetota bacterium]HIJ72141.1 hypothetical protein [Planctomycetota bacterium]